MHIRAAPVGEEAHAMRGAHDRIEIFGERCERQAEIDILPGVKHRLDGKRERHDRAERAEMDDRAGEGVALLGA
jgi:hypothetical protein